MISVRPPMFINQGGKFRIGVANISAPDCILDVEVPAITLLEKSELKVIFSLIIELVSTLL